MTILIIKEPIAYDRLRSVMMNLFLLGSTGGLISCLATCLGALLSLGRVPSGPMQKLRLSIDFALGLVVSAAAFSLLGPVAWEAKDNGQLFQVMAYGLVAGVVAVSCLKALSHRLHPKTQAESQGPLLLAIVLMVHNFPEGLASGAALLGLDWAKAWSVLASIALQNVPEGLLMVVCLKALGLGPKAALAGGFGSGLIELLGGMGAGFFMGFSAHSLPFMLCAAGGAMLTSVLVELSEGQSIKARLFNQRFALGLLIIPLLNAVLLVF